MRRRFFFISLLIFCTLSVFSAERNTLSQQYAVSLSYTTEELTPVSGFMKTVLTYGGNDYTALLRADQRSMDMAISTRLRFGKDHGTTIALNDTVPTERDRLSFFTEAAAETNLMPGFGNTYVIAFSLGQEFTLGHGFYQAGVSYEVGLYAHMTSFDGFEGVIFTLNPSYGITLSSRINNRFFLDLSLITKVPAYYPKQTTYGFRLSSAFLFSETFSLGYDGYFLFSDYLGETEFINKAEHSIFFTWSFAI